MTSHQWTKADAARARSEGWGIFTAYLSEGGSEVQIQRTGEPSIFEDDYAAILYVVRRAAICNSEFHRRAVLILKDLNPSEIEGTIWRLYE